MDQVIRIALTVDEVHLLLRSILSAGNQAAKAGVDEQPFLELYASLEASLQSQE